MRPFDGVQFLNKRVELFVIFHQMFQSAEEIFLKLFNNPDETFKKIYFKRLSIPLNLI